MALLEDKLKKSKILLRGLKNFRTNKPLCVSFEVTWSCTANCKHCDKGGLKKEKNIITPEKCRDYVLSLKPPVVQISGGEPLTRKDITNVIRAIKQPNGLPLIIFISNASLLTEKKYVELKEAGVDRFSISLDFPNSLHDEFRRTPGLYKHLNEIIPHLARKYKNNDIAMNSAITLDNLKYIIPLAEKTTEWGVEISYSAYSSLRTGNKGYLVSSKKDLSILWKGFNDLIKLKKTNKKILNPKGDLLRTYQFFKDGQIPNCKAGLRFLVVRPDSYLNACSMFPEKIYSTHEEMMEKFTKNNKCGECFVSIRAYTDKSIWNMLKENISKELST